MLMHFTNQLSRQQCDQRDQMLEETLRAGSLICPIKDEYPIVLSDPYSYCLLQDNRVISHANLWPRHLFSELENQRTIPIGLIGNVATAKKFQGLGLARKMLNHLLSIATDTGLHAVMLWSDLGQFYQKLGFQSFAQERRLWFVCTDHENVSRATEIMNPNSLTDDQIVKMWDLRPKTKWTLRRSIPEYRKLLGIPGVVLSVEIENNEIVAFAICGKGADLQGVIHEWGGQPTHIERLAKKLCTMYGLDEIMLLAPRELLDGVLMNGLRRLASREEVHGMAWGIWLNEQHRAEEQSVFIWGLDSI